MCGIAGFISSGSADEGSHLAEMLKQLVHRGTDASGVAFFEKRETAKLRVSLSSARRQADLEALVANMVEVTSARCYAGRGVFHFCEFDFKADDRQIRELNWAIDSDPEMCVHSIGPRITIVKDEGSAAQLADTHAIKPVACTHGIGHVRLATESVENINLAHPFTSYLMPELALVHNGQFTNYLNMRRLMESKGVRFKTTNDSEMAAHFVAWKMTQFGLSLEEALLEGLDTFDGVFTLLVATETQVGALRDRLGIKPMVYYQHDNGSVLFGSEQICLTPIVADVYATEMEPGEVKTWSV